MNEGKVPGFIVDGEPRLMGSGGPGGQPRGAQTASLIESLNKVAGIWNIEKLEPERAAAVICYMTDHCIDRLTELLAFFGEEFGAIVSEAMEATDAKGGDSDE